MQDEAGKPGKPDGSSESERKAPKKGAKAPTSTAQADSNRRMLRIGVIALAVLVGVIAWVATQGDDGESTTPASTGTEDRIVSVEELEDFAGSTGHPVYWAGPLPGKVLELSESAEGNVQIRYLDEGTEAGGGAAVLTVGSYPLGDAAAAVEGFAEREDSIVRRSDEGREVAFSTAKPTSVYFADPEGGVQVEVYDPSYKRAMGLALSDQVRPVG